MESCMDKFGSMVFSDAVMRRRLPEDIYAKLKRTVRGGHKLDPQVAGAVADAMKNWAIEKGATHFTHWLRALYGYQFGHPGKKLTFMGSEFGQFIEWNWKQGLDWLLLDYPRHVELRRFMKALNHLYTETPALYTVDRSWDGFKWLNVDDAGRSSVAFLRSAEKENSYMVCVCNFTPVSYEDFVIGLPHAGTLKEVLNSDDFQYGGKGMGNPKLIRSKKESFLDMQYSAALTLPAMSTLFFRYTLKKEKPDKKAAGKGKKKKS